MISNLERRIITAAIVNQYNNGADIAATLRSYSKLTYDEKNEIYKEITGENLPIGIEEAKATKIAELSVMCNTIIENGADVELGTVTEHFSYKLANGDQTNIDNLMVSARTTGMPQPYHADGGDCRMYSVEEIFKIYMALMSNKTVQTTYFNQLKRYIINEFKTDDDVKFVTLIKYGDQLTGEYMSKYIEIIKESADIMNQFVSKFTKEMKDSTAKTDMSVSIGNMDPTNVEYSTTRQH